MEVLHPLGEVHPDDPLGVEGCGGEFVAVGRHHVGVPDVREGQAVFAESVRREEALEEALGLVPVLCARRARDALPVDSDAERPASALLALKRTHAFFPCHCVFLSL